MWQSVAPEHLKPRRPAGQVLTATRPTGRRGPFAWQWITSGDARFLFDIPARYTPETRAVPTAEEVGPWIDAIIRLRDDTLEYDRWSQAARERAQECHPDRLAPIYHDFFNRLTHQPSPPLVPRRVDAV